MVCKQCWGLGVRHVQLVLIGCVFAVMHIFRVSPLMAILLAKHEVQDSASFHEDPFKITVVNWEDEDILILHNIVYFTLPFSFFIGAVISTKWNNKYILLVCVLCMSAQSFALPSIVRSRSELVGWWAICMMRIFIGLLQGISEPVCYQILGRWVTTRDYCKASALLAKGSMAGWLLINGVIFFIGKSVMGWSSIFYTSGNIGVLWCVAWFTFGSKDFRECFYISSEEKTFMVSNTNDLDSFGLGGPKSGKRPIKWKKILSSKDFIVLLVSHFMVSWTHSNILFPRFIEKSFEGLLTQTRDVQKPLIGMQAFFGYNVCITVWLLVMGIICDKIVNQKKVVSSHQRKTCNSIGFWGSAVTFIMIGYVTDPEAILGWTVAFSLAGSFRWVGIDVAFIEMAPNYAGFIYGFIRSITHIPLTFVIVVETITLQFEMDEADLRLQLFLGALVNYLANFIYCNGFNTKCQEWNKVGVAPKSLSVVFN